ncbi:hypothetical protein [Mesorhizobium sp. NZP2077]|uniref:hypothetical protein n=1 Tax=Mesorhizobium sp. NZP2077 TaxID=2483404 RepID=UPI0015581687|nr:hypothetical protein [Mesorhizobium sp. NZP2077]QKD18742.1 hypothetical protein HGP13_28920 [Mesorhizobium sp. NZP2077]
MTEKDGNGPVKAVRHHNHRSDRQRGPARTKQLGMRSRAFKGGIAAKNDLFAVAVFQPVIWRVVFAEPEPSDALSADQVSEPQHAPLTCA